MDFVNVTRLKKKLSHYLKRAQRGQEIVVTSHRHRVARILPMADTSLNRRKPSRPVRDLLDLRVIKNHPEGSAVDTLI